MSKLEKLINELNLVGTVSFDVRKEHWNKLNEKEHEICVDILTEHGATAKEVTQLLGDDYFQIFYLDGHKFTLSFTKQPDKSERIAELKRELAELEKGELTNVTN